MHRSEVLKSSSSVSNDFPKKASRGRSGIFSPAGVSAGSRPSGGSTMSEVAARRAAARHSDQCVGPCSLPTWPVRSALSSFDGLFRLRSPLREFRISQCGPCPKLLGALERHTGHAVARPDALQVRVSPRGLGRRPLPGPPSAVCPRRFGSGPQSRTDAAVTRIVTAVRTPSAAEKRRLIFNLPQMKLTRGGWSWTDISTIYNPGLALR